MEGVGTGASILRHAVVVGVLISLGTGSTAGDVITGATKEIPAHMACATMPS